MKLRNKQTGEIGKLSVYTDGHVSVDDVVSPWSENTIKSYNFLAELNEEWEDYNPKVFYYINENGGVLRYIPSDPEGEDETYIKYQKEIGNHFSSREEAELAVRKLKAWKRLKDKGISFEAKVIDGKWYLAPKAEPQQRTFDETHDVFKDIMFIFGGEK